MECVVDEHESRDISWLKVSYEQQDQFWDLEETFAC